MPYDNIKIFVMVHNSLIDGSIYILKGIVGCDRNSFKMIWLTDFFFWNIPYRN